MCGFGATTPRSAYVFILFIPKRSNLNLKKAGVGKVAASKVLGLAKGFKGHKFDLHKISTSRGMVFQSRTMCVLVQTGAGHGFLSDSECALIARLFF